MNKRRLEISAEVIDIIDDTTNDSGQKAKKQKLSLPRILDGNFFSVVSHVEGKIDARCTECEKPIKGHITSTGNFKNHYRIKHASIMTSLEDYLKDRSDDVSVNGIKSRQSTISEFSSNANIEKVI